MVLDFSTERKPLMTFSLAGVADVVLLLLIFFLLTSNFVPRMGIQVDLPQAGASSPAEEAFVPVAITGEGAFFVGQREVAGEDLTTALRTQKNEKGTDGLLLRADEQATVRQFAAVATAAQALRMRVVMATRPEADASATPQ
ncbi:MAG: biopolymer transporter ExbD [Bacteroidetes bacterium QS_9_68_14]|nr:MAG: biopolymer transporter ExbD [Bacteroidetes bacterium QS_9_68_14]